MYYFLADYYFTTLLPTVPVAPVTKIVFVISKLCANVMFTRFADLIYCCLLVAG
jgi:hypothetical protein